MGLLIPLWKSSSREGLEETNGRRSGECVVRVGDGRTGRVMDREGDGVCIWGEVVYA